MPGPPNQNAFDNASQTGKTNGAAFGNGGGGNGNGNGNGNSPVDAVDDSVTVSINGSATVDVLANDTGPGNSTLAVIAIEGIAVLPGDTITLATGQTVTLNANGTLTVTGDGDVETVSFSYTIASGGGSGIVDTAFVTIDAIPCFVRGSRILTDRGYRRVENLREGDMVRTMDEGYQPVRWSGRRRVAAQGAFAPIRIRAGTFGAKRDLWVSPQHRMLIADLWAELMFGEREVLVAAKDLVNGGSVQRLESDSEVEYHHLLFDSHQVIYAEGLATESFLPGPMTLDAFDGAVQAEICALFPELDPETGLGYGAAARLTLKSYEAGLLAAQVA